MEHTNVLAVCWVRDYCSVFTSYEKNKYFILKSKGLQQFFNTQCFIQEIFMRWNSFVISSLKFRENILPGLFCIQTYDSTIYNPTMHNSYTNYVFLYVICKLMWEKAAYIELKTSLDNSSWVRFLIFQLRN